MIGHKDEKRCIFYPFTCGGVDSCYVCYIVFYFQKVGLLMIFYFSMRWIGNDAASRGLVDAIGGLSRAVAIAKQKANIPQDKQLGNWQASIEDYEVLARELPEDEEVSKAIREAKDQLTKQQVSLPYKTDGSIKIIMKTNQVLCVLYICVILYNKNYQERKRQVSSPCNKH